MKTDNLNTGEYYYLIHIARFKPDGSREFRQLEFEYDSRTHFTAKFVGNYDISFHENDPGREYFKFEICQYPGFRAGVMDTVWLNWDQVARYVWPTDKTAESLIEIRHIDDLYQI